MVPGYIGLFEIVKMITLWWPRLKLPPALKVHPSFRVPAEPSPLPGLLAVHPVYSVHCLLDFRCQGQVFHIPG